MPSCRNMPSMPNVRASSGTIGTTRGPMSLSRTSDASILHEHHRRRDLAIAAAFELRIEYRKVGHFDVVLDDDAARNESTEPFSIAPQIHHLRRVGCRTVVRHAREVVVGQRNAELIAKVLQVLETQLFHGVRRVLRLAAFAHSVTLDGLREDDGRLASMMHRRVIRRVDLERIVAAAVQTHDVGIGEFLHHLQQLGRFAEEMLARVRAALGLVVLILAVDGLVHALLHQSLVVVGEQRIPQATPNHLDDVPAGAAKRAFEFLNDLAVAANGSVETLQVAVDDEDQVVESSRARRDPSTPNDSGSSHSPSPRNAHTLRSPIGTRPRLSRYFMMCA